MKRLFGVLILAISLVAADRPVFAQAAAEESARLVRALADDLRVAAKLPGISIAVSQNGRIVFAEGLGYADLATKRPVTPETQFRAASVSKVITVTALGKLVQENRLNLDAPIDDYVPGFPAKAWPITTRQLAGHLAGVPHYSEQDRIEAQFYPSVADALGVFAHIDLVSEPGTAYRYTTHGYTLLSAVIEGAARRPFLDFMAQEVFRPLGMRATGPDLRAEPPASMTKLHALEDGGMLTEIAAPEDPSYKWAGGGLITTPTDLLRMADAYFNGFLHPETVAIMFRSQRLTSGQETGVGIGWRNAWDMQGRRVIEHAGSMEGTRSVICIFPDERLAIAVMANRGWSSLIEETAHMMALPFLTAPSPASQPEGRAELTLTLVNARGEESRKPGRLILERGRGRLIVDPDQTEEQTYALVYLERENLYALVRPDGIFYTTLDFSDGMVRGSSVGYGSPQLAPPVQNPPFLSFEARFPD